MTNYEDLAAELRLQALCLPVPTINRGGRPRQLIFRRRLDIGGLYWKMSGGFARRGRSTRDPALNPILKQIGRRRAAGNLFAAARLSKQADQLGRFNSVPILPPESLPATDEAVAREYARLTGFRTTVRMVRASRTDKRVRTILGPLPWEVPEWLVKEAEQMQLRAQALALVTPERLAKGDLYLRHGALAAKQDRSAEDAHLTAGGLLGLQKWMAELLPSEHRRPPYFLGCKPQWRRIDAQPDLERVRINRHPRGRRINKVVYDDGMPKRETD
jgi:hypothetical protein